MRHFLSGGLNDVGREEAAAWVWPGSDPAAWCRVHSPARAVHGACVVECGEVGEWVGGDDQYVGVEAGG